MITLIALSLAFATPVATGEEPPADTCPAELATANRLLEECKQELEAAKPQPSAPRSQRRTEQNIRIGGTAPAPAPAADTNPPPGDDDSDDEAAEDEEIDHLFDDPPSPTAAPNNYVLAPDPGPMVTQVAIDFPKKEPKERRTREPREPKEPRASKEPKADAEEDEVTEDSPDSSGNARFSVLAGASGGGVYYAGTVKDGSGVVLAKDYSAQANFWGGVTMNEHRGYTLGILAHGGIDPITLGSNVSGGVMVLRSVGPVRLGLEVGGSYTAFKSLVGVGADAWIDGGEVLAVGLVPFGKESSPVRVNLLLAGGVDGGLLNNADPTDTTYAALPVAHVGLVFSFNTKQF